MLKASDEFASLLSVITWEDAQGVGVNVAHGNGFEDQL